MHDWIKSADSMHWQASFSNSRHLISGSLLRFRQCTITSLSCRQPQCMCKHSSSCSSLLFLQALSCSSSTVGSVAPLAGWSLIWIPTGWLWLTNSNIILFSIIWCNWVEVVPATCRNFWPIRQLFSSAFCRGNCLCGILNFLTKSMCNHPLSNNRDLSTFHIWFIISLGIISREDSLAGSPISSFPLLQWCCRKNRWLLQRLQIWKIWANSLVFSFQNPHPLMPICLRSMQIKYAKFLFITIRQGRVHVLYTCSVFQMRIFNISIFLDNIYLARLMGICLKNHNLLHRSDYMKPYIIMYLEFLRITTTRAWHRNKYILWNISIWLYKQRKHIRCQMNQGKKGYIGYPPT